MQIQNKTLWLVVIDALGYVERTDFAGQYGAVAPILFPIIVNWHHVLKAAAIVRVQAWLGRFLSRLCARRRGSWVGKGHGSREEGAGSITLPVSLPT